MDNKIGILDFALAYLAGPIDNAADKGVEWRTYFRGKLVELGINLVVLDPTDKLSALRPDVGAEQDTIRKFREEQDWDGLSAFVRPIVRVDLRQIDYCDILVVYVDVDVHMCGTYDELRNAIDQKKPILAIIKGGKKRAPSWLFGILHHQYMFDTVDECIEYLDGVNKGEIELSDRYVLIRKQVFEIMQRQIPGGTKLC